LPRIANALNSLAMLMLFSVAVVLVGVLQADSKPRR